MTGCPYELIYSAAQTFNVLRHASRVTFNGGFLALKIIEEANRVTVITREIATGRTHAQDKQRDRFDLASFGGMLPAAVMSANSFRILTPFPLEIAAQPEIRMEL